ncbi:MAG: hypothetical protein ACYC0Q_00730 [Eubacteriales bacterium]
MQKNVLNDSGRLTKWLNTARESAGLSREARKWSALICLRSGSQEVRLAFREGVLELLDGKEPFALETCPETICLEGEPEAWEEIFSGLSLNRAVRELKIKIKGNIREAMKNWLALWTLFELAH